MPVVTLSQNNIKLLSNVILYSDGSSIACEGQHWEKFILESRLKNNLWPQVKYNEIYIQAKQLD